MKILINTPNYHDPSSGGVASFYSGMIGYWHENVRYNIVGRRMKITGALWLPFDAIKFIYKLLAWKPDIVVVNPSLFLDALLRDFFFLRIAKLFRIPVVVIIHGFNLDIARSINHQWVTSNLNKSLLVMVLADQFRNILRSWKVTVPIELISTKVEDRMLDGFDIGIRDGKVKNLLFLSRMIEEKGVYETIDTFQILKKEFPHLKLTMVGGGPELLSLKEYVAKNQVVDVVFTGPLSGEDRLRAYREASFFLFFTSYGEGMPTVVLEAMAFGMPVITRKVGGLVDFFEDGKMGRITDSLDPKDFAEMMKPFVKDKELTKKVAVYNYQYALEHFMATKVGKKIESLIKQVC